MKRTLTRVAVAFLLLAGVLATTTPLMAQHDEEGEGGNNLSVPVIFAEGYGLTGFEVDQDDVLSTGIPGLLKAPCEGEENWGDVYDIRYEILGEVLTTAAEEPGATVYTYEFYIDDQLYYTLDGTTVPADGSYHLQPYDLTPDAGGDAVSFGGSTCWQADWLDGSTLAEPAQVDMIDWGDNLVRALWSEGTNPIRVEVNLFQAAAGEPGTFQDGNALEGYDVLALWPPGFQDGKPPAVGDGMKQEVWGVATGDPGAEEVVPPTKIPTEVASIFTTNARMQIHALSWSVIPDSFQDADLTGYPAGEIPNTFDPDYDDWVSHVHLDANVGGHGEGGLGAEVNQGGRVLYGYSLGLSSGVESGWYRITFNIDDQVGNIAANAELVGLNEVDTLPDESDGVGMGKKGFFPPTLVEDPVNGNYTFLDIYVVGDSDDHGKMHGKASDANGGPLDGIVVTVYDQSDQPAATAVTDTNGAYEFSLLTGSYRVEFSDPSGEYATVWWNGKADGTTADVVMITDGGSMMVNAVMHRQAHIDGHVKGYVNGHAIEGATVDVYRTSGEHIGTFTTDANGAFSAALGAGDYKVRATAAGHLDTWYVDKTDMGAADVVSLDEGESLSLSISMMPSGWFGDVDPHGMFAADIQWLMEHGITLGCDPDGTMFCPMNSVTRAQMASFIVRALELTEGADVDAFTDDDGSVHEPNINRLAHAGITVGCEEGKFCPDAEISRAQMASLLARAFHLEEGADHDAFTDDDGSVHEQNINRIAYEGITRGCTDDTFCPNDPVIRQHMAAFLHRCFE